jgi:hypothetical protein
MNDTFETEALRYLLNEMDAGSRAEFEARLERDPAARVALKSCADAMAQFACEQAPAEPMSAVDQRAALNVILATAKSESVEDVTPVVAKNVIPWSRVVWPMAAAVLLTLNLIDFRRPVPARGGALAGGEATTLAGEAGRRAELAANGSGAEGRVSGSEESRGGATDASAPTSRVEAERQIAAKFAADLAKTSRELAKLRDDHAKLQRTNAALRVDYDAVVRQWASRVAFDQSVGRLAAMELVDAESYARGSRKGLVEVARGILTEPGVIVAMDGPVRPGVEPPPATSSTDPQTAALAPYAWAVFDDKEQRGYLNLYNLPSVEPDESLQLWVRAVDRAEYQRVGEVPATFYGGSGSLQYQMTEAVAPAEILITLEPRDAVVEQPAGPTVLRGP